ncbi:MAG: hydrogenase maturation protease [Armatimonadetes bacterium]|nr:hydrogenase maturation protease [Armatimonadota bacterium]
MQASSDNRRLLVIGVGNTLRGDDGVGVRIAQALAERPLPEHVTVLDGGTEGLDLLFHLETADRVILIDAANMGEAPGEAKVLEADRLAEAPGVGFSSTHGFGVAEVLALGRSVGIDPHVTVVGIQPEDARLRDGLSESLARRMPEYVRLVEGITLLDREYATSPTGGQRSDFSGQDPRR